MLLFVHTLSRHSFCIRWIFNCVLIKMDFMTVQKLICSENRFIIYDIKGRSGAGRTGFLPQSSSLHGLSGGGRDSPTRTKGHKPLVLQKLPPSNSGQANGVQINHVRILNLPITRKHRASPGYSRSQYSVSVLDRTSCRFRNTPNLI